MKSTSFKFAILALLVLTIGIFDLGNAPTTLADDPPPFVSLPGQAATPSRAQQSKKESSKISSVIRGVLRDLKATGITRSNGQAEDFLPFSREKVLRVSAIGDIQAYIFVEESGEDEIESLEKLGARVEIVNQDHNIVQAWIPFDKVEPMAELGIVRKIRTPDYAFTRAGTVTTEGDQILNSDDVRDLLGITGAGTKIGVISDGVHSRSVAQATGDLPGSIEINPSLPGVIEPLFPGDGDEGTAMLEIIHDIAPNASLAFSGFQTSGNFTTLDMVNSVNFLANDAFGGTGADIIVDDLGFFFEPFFEDGIVAQAVQNVVDNGTIYVSAAGNDANTHYEGDYLENGDFLHDFEGGDTGMSVTVASGGLFLPVLQWNDKFGLSDQDYDLAACFPGFTPNSEILGDVEDINDVCFFGEEEQDGNDDPFEFLALTNNGTEAADIDLFVIAFSVDEVRLLELYVFGNVSVNEHNVSAGSVFGHPAVPRAIAVGAIDAGDPGHDTIEPFSSRGPSEIFFPSPESRDKPDLAAIDGVSVTGAGGFSNPFFGTSASAPHVAGIAALLLQAIRVDQPGISKVDAATQVFDTLLGTAVDLGSAGFDTTFGAGRVDALTAVQATGVSLSPLTVDSTGDVGDDNLADLLCDDGSGKCTLRAAIEQANFNVGADLIGFNIPGAGPHTIQPASALPTITDPVIIDGYTQPGASPNTNGPGLGLNTVLKIELDGTNAGAGADGLTITGGDSTVRGLVINRFNSEFGNNILLRSQGGNVIEGNFLGTDVTGTVGLGSVGLANGGSGVYIGSPNNLIGGTSAAARNVISGNRFGVRHAESTATGNLVQGNLIGTDLTGTAALGNTEGVHFQISASNNTVGGTTPEAR
ncbi:MAG: S8 family serine peptidase, partial [Chloroflexi bacterium]|nr:S8 family serine peptidase [Chloroflexota bacterium]